MGHPALNGPLSVFVRKKAKDYARGERVASADSIQYLQWSLWNVNCLSLIQCDRTTVIFRRGVRRTQRGCKQLQIRIELGDTNQHRFVLCNRQTAEVVADAFDCDTEGRREILLITEENVHSRYQFAVYILSLSLAANPFPERFPIIEVVGNQCPRTGPPK